MIQNQLGSVAFEIPMGKSAVKKKTFKKKVITKKATKEKVDLETRFFNNYGENPHLQEIENGYLLYLEA
jgi:hypothetical protein